MDVCFEKGIVFLGNRSFRKIPSILWLDDDKNVIDWGTPNPPGTGCHKLEWFKLMVLFRDQLRELKTSKRFIETQNNLDKLGLDVLDAISLYLSRLWALFKEQAKVDLHGSSFDACCVHLTLTKPANWPKDAVTRLQDAVRNAGISCDVKTLDEAEAAGVTLLTGQASRMEVNVWQNLEAPASTIPSAQIIDFPVQDPLDSMFLYPCNYCG